MDVALLLAAGFAALVLLSASLALYARRLQRQLHELRCKKRSQSTRYGQISEQFAPFMASWPWNPKEFRFLGSPIDGVQFCDDEVILIEIKSSRSQLNSKQRHIRDLVKAGKVRFEEVRIE